MADINSPGSPRDKNSYSYSIDTFTDIIFYKSMHVLKNDNLIGEMPISLAQPVAS